MSKRKAQVVSGITFSGLRIFFLLVSFRFAASMGCILSNGCAVPLSIQIYVIGVPLIGGLTFVACGLFMVVRSLRTGTLTVLL